MREEPFRRVRRLRFVREYRPLLFTLAKYRVGEVATIAPLWLADALVDLGYAVDAR